jgi:predicted nucleic acid-binding protein
MQFVLDCSVAISWCLVDENNDYANAILALMPDSEAFVPLIWSLEVANTLLVAERRLPLGIAYLRHIALLVKS